MHANESVLSRAKVMLAGGCPRCGSNQIDLSLDLPACFHCGCVQTTDVHPPAAFEPNVLAPAAMPDFSMPDFSCPWLGVPTATVVDLTDSPTLDAGTPTAQAPEEQVLPSSARVDTPSMQTAGAQAAGLVQPTSVADPEMIKQFVAQFSQSTPSLHQIRELATALGIGVNKVRQLLEEQRIDNIPDVNDGSSGAPPESAAGTNTQQESVRGLKRSASCLSEEAAPAKRTRAAEALDPDLDTVWDPNVEAEPDPGETGEMQRARARQTANQIASKHGGHCKGVSRASQGQGLVGSWQCKFGHSFELLLAQAKAGEWCQPCHRWNQLLTEGQTIAATMHGMLLTKDMSHYGVSRGFLTWFCGQGHRFDMAIADVRAGHWCPTCRMQQELRQQNSENQAAAAAAAAAAATQQRQWQQQQQQQRLFTEAKKRQQASASRTTNRRGRGVARAQQVRKPQPVMPTSVPADAKYSLEQVQMIFKVLVQPPGAIHTFRAIAGILPSDIPKDVQRKLRSTLAKLHPDRNLAPNAIQAFQRLSQVRDQLLRSMGL